MSEPLPCADCPHEIDDHADGPCTRCSCPGFVELTRELWEADRAAEQFSALLDGAA